MHVHQYAQIARTYACALVRRHGHAGLPRYLPLTQNVNELACKWAKAEISIADDRELQDAPDGPFGNKGGLYIESRIQIVEGKDGVTVTSPTITTPLDGVPPPFLAGHYMKVLCPFAS